MLQIAGYFCFKRQIKGNKQSVIGTGEYMFSMGPGDFLSVKTEDRGLLAMTDENDILIVSIESWTNAVILIIDHGFLRCK